MKSPLDRSLRAVALLALATGVARGQDAGAGSIDAIWNDPIFKRQFIGSYGINSEIEPRFSPEEALILEKILPLMAENLPKAEEVLKKQLKPDCSASLDFTLGGIQFQQDKMVEALENYRKAVAKFPSFCRAWRNLGLLYAFEGDNDQAIVAFTRMIELGGGDAYAYGALGIAYSSKEDYQPAEASYRNALLLQPENTEWRLGLTRCVFKQEKFEDAAALLDVLIARYPDNADFWLLQAHTFLGMKQPLKAAENLEAMDRLDKATVDSLNLLGDIYASENLPDLAGPVYQRAIDLDESKSLARPLRAAEVLIGRGATTQAKELAAHIRAVWGDGMAEADAHKLLKLEARLSMADGAGSSETVRVLEEIVALDPLDGEALMLLGQHHARQNEPDRAILYYERAANLPALEVKAKVSQAQVLVGMGRYADAVPLLRRAQEIKPRDDIARYLEQVERVAKARN